MWWLTHYLVQPCLARLPTTPRCLRTMFPIRRQSSMSVDACHEHFTLLDSHMVHTAFLQYIPLDVSQLLLDDVQLRGGVAREESLKRMSPNAYSTMCKCGGSVARESSLKSKSTTPSHMLCAPISTTKCVNRFSRKIAKISFSNISGKPSRRKQLHYRRRNHVSEAR